MLTTQDAERFARAKRRMRALVGPRVYDCWFVGLQANDLKDRKRTGRSLLLSVATVSPRHSITTHYMHAVETACKEEWPDLQHIAIVVRTLGQEPLWGDERSTLREQNRSTDLKSEDLDERLKAYAPTE